MTIYSGVVKENNKSVGVYYNPGWGEIGEWYMLYSDGHKVTVDNMEGFADNQYDCLMKYTSDEYREKLILCNWETVGNNDDIVRRVLEFVDYDDDSVLEDDRLIQEIQEKISDKILDLGTHVNSVDFNVRTTEKKLSDIDAYVKDYASVIDAINHRMRVFDMLSEGKPVGLNWSNETFFRDYGDTVLAKQFKHLVEK